MSISQREHDDKASSKRSSVAALIALVAQNTLVVILLKQSFKEGAKKYSVSSVIFLSEVFKLFASAFMLSARSGRENAFVPLLMRTQAEPHMLLPCLLYVVQNILLFRAVQDLSPLVYIVCSQAKILTSAFFSMLLLGTRLSRAQSAALVLLTAGIVLVQVSTAPPDETHEALVSQLNKQSRGLVAVFAASFTSGFAGVYLEKIFKDSSASIWVRNFQLSFYSVPVSAITMCLRDRSIFEVGIFHGYNTVVSAILLLQGLGGLLVSAVMKHAGNILKCFAISISICLCTLYAVWNEEQLVTRNMNAGICLVILSTFLYTRKR